MRFQNRMRDDDFFLGLDMNGHIFFSKQEFYGIDDPILAALKVMELCDQPDGRKISLSSLTKCPILSYRLLRLSILPIIIRNIILMR